MSDLQTVPVGRADATVLLRDRRLVGLTALSRRVDLLTPLPRPQVRALPTTALLGDVPDGIYLWSRPAGGADVCGGCWAGISSSRAYRSVPGPRVIGWGGFAGPCR